MGNFSPFMRFYVHPQHNRNIRPARILFTGEDAFDKISNFIINAISYSRLVDIPVLHPPQLSYRTHLAFIILDRETVLCPWEYMELSII